MPEITLSDVIAGGSAVASVFNPGVGAAIGVIGGLISGSQPSVSGITAAQQGALSGGFGGPVTSTGTSVGPTVIDTTGPFNEAGLGAAAGRVITALPKILPSLAGGAAGNVVARAVIPGGPTGSMKTMTRRQFILATARAANPGATAKKIIRTARQCGIELAAATFGLDAMSVCFLIAETPTRRRRGISAADITRTRATIRKVNSLKELCPPATRRRRK